MSEKETAISTTTPPDNTCDPLEVTDISLTTAAVVSWRHDGLLTDATFKLERVASTNVALFQLSINVALKDVPSVKTPLSVIVHPRDITALRSRHVDIDRDSQSDIPEVIQPALKRVLGSQITCLQFSLSAPSTLIGPKGQYPRPRHQASVPIIDAICALSQETEFDLFLTCNVLSQTQRESLCAEIESRSLSTVANDRYIARLNRGKGRRIILAPTATISGDDADVDDNTPGAGTMPPPPSYNQVLPPAPAPPLFSSQRKISC